jgi:hypothetical protein
MRKHAIGIMKKLLWNWEKSFGEQWSSRFSIDEFVSPALTDSSCPFKRMKTFFTGAKDAWEDARLKTEYYYNNRNSEIPELQSSTLKVCPAQQKLFNNSFIIKSPMDFIISYDCNRESAVSISGPPEMSGIEVTQHNIIQTQLDDGSNLIDGKIVIKIKLPILIECESDFFYTDAFWNNKNPHRILPGIVPKNLCTNIIFFVHYPLPKQGELAHINIKRGEPMAYMYTVDKHKMHYDPNLRPHFRKTFLRGMFAN